ncbi:hypothetical protein IW138_003044 [Coemansia sp. RSA 986]|nr:hypothetical protein IW138_003044 [Coemansia sp. RSA 986]
MSFGPAQLNSAVSLLDEKIAELETAIASASNDAQARISRDLKRAWEGVYNALSFSPTPASQSPCSYSMWAANSSPRFPPNANVPLEPQEHSGNAGSGSMAAELSIHDLTGSTLCDGCKQHASDVLWVCISCRGRHRLCNSCKVSNTHHSPASEDASSHKHRYVAWPLLCKTIKDDQCIMCDSCNKVVIGIRWVCTDCESYDMCSDCANTATHEHPLKPIYTSETSVHPLNTVQYTCNHCSSRMAPPVFGCTKCSDFHVCLKCTGLGKMCTDHDYAAINVDSSHAASDNACTERPSDEAVASNSGISPKSEGKQSDKTPQVNTPKNPSDPMSVSAVTCNECNRAVVGIRHRCTRCKDYDMCDDCYRSVSISHPGHGFVHFGPPLPPQQQHRPLPGSGHPHPHPHSHGYRHPGGTHHRPGPVFIPHTHTPVRPSPPHHHHHHQQHHHQRHHYHHRQHPIHREPALGSFGGLFGGPVGGLQACRMVVPPMESASPTRPPPPFMPHASMRLPTALSPPALPSFPGCMLPRLPSCNDKQQQTDSVERVERGTGTSEEPAAPKPVHVSVCCDACNKLIVGVRFKCGNCLDYDLCEKCEADSEHNSDHLLIKIRTPRTTPNNRPMLPMIYPPAKPTVRAPKQPPTAPAIGAQHAPAPSPAVAVSRKAEHDNNIMQTTKYVAVYVEDITVPDGTVVSANEMFVKIWSVANVGNTEWPHGTMLVHMGGEPSIRENRKTVPIVVGKRYEQVGIAVDLVAPSEPGLHKSKWRLMTPDGYYFGSELWCSIVVESSSSSSAVPLAMPSSQPEFPHPYLAICPAKPNDSSAAPAVPSPPANGLGIIPSPAHSKACVAKDLIAPPPTAANVPTVESKPAAELPEMSSVSTPASSVSRSVGGNSDTVVENLSDIFVKIGADLMQEIRRLDQSVKELQHRQNKLDTDRSFEITSAPKEGPSETTQIKAYPQEELAPGASGPDAATGKGYSEIDLLTSPPLNEQHHITSPASAAGSDAHSDTSSMREFYSSAARLEQLLNTSRTTATSSMSLSSRTSSSALNFNGTVPHSSSHSHRGSNSNSNSSSNSSDDANEFEFVNDFVSNGKASPKDI